MMNNDKKAGPDRRGSGRVYFSRQTEQTISFYLTLAMLLAGLVCRLI